MRFGPGGGEKLFDPWASGRRGQECPQEIRSKMFIFMLFSLLNFVELCTMLKISEGWEPPETDHH